ncbi:hypothetical protein GCM10010521_63670 [Streptomyces rameus]|uniref:Putative glutamate--cysteine ligase 2 n=1 Tax=Streptomyces rameus TaxID=68261 RepID=A0ABP6HI19_9ACTN
MTSGNDGTTQLTVGVEEEYLLVDPVTREVDPAGDQVVALASSSGLGDRVSVELTRYQVEARTDPHVESKDLGEQIRAMRAAVADSAAQLNLRIVSSGSPVLGPAAPPPLSRGPRYALSAATFRALDDEQTACALHIHIGMPDLTRAVQVSNHMRCRLPVLIALSANSPYWLGRDTGYASWRTMAWARWPVSGPPPYFASRGHFDDLVGGLLEAGAILDRGGLYWDIRPSHHVPTLEIRVADAVTTAEETLLLCAVVRALAATALKAVADGEPAPRPRPEVLRAACWRAARDGLTGHSLDPVTSALIPSPVHIEQCLAAVEPALRDHGDLELVRTGWNRLCADGNGADRQRVVHQRRSSLPDVVDHLITHTAPPDPRAVPMASWPVPLDAGPAGGGRGAVMQDRPMKNTSRRSVLASAAAVAAGLPTLNAVVGTGATPAAAADQYKSNTDLYTRTAAKEGTDWMRRFRIGAPVQVTDNARSTSSAVSSTAVIAPHGGGIEAGTSELCLAVAGYTPFDANTDPAAAALPGEPQRDYWMFEAIANSTAQHVTATHCDDPAALAVCANNLYAVSLHGFDDTTVKKIIIGGRDERLKRNLLAAFTKYGLTSPATDADRDVTVVFAGATDPINGDDPANIANRTRTGAGAQLELSTALRQAMFGDFSGAAKRRTTAGVPSTAAPYADHFWNGFVGAVREAVKNHELGLDSLG